MRPGQVLNNLYGRLLAALEEVLSREEPDLILVQGDTTSALAGAQAGFHRGIPVAHIEAGRHQQPAQSLSGRDEPAAHFAGLARYHFAATPGNRDALLAEGVDPATIFVTGNPVVDSLHTILDRPLSPTVQDVLQATAGLKRIVLTTHRRESFAGPMEANLARSPRVHRAP